MQRLLRVLRDGDREAGSPATDPVTVETAVAAAAARGWHVELAERGEPAVTSPGAVIAAARIVEELLEGPAPGGAGALVARILHRPAGLRAQLSGSGPVPSALRESSSRARLHERAELHGGRVRTRRRAGGWAISIELPGTHGGSTSGSRISDAVVVALACGAVAADAFAGAAERPALTLVAGAALLAAPLTARRRAPLAVALVIAAGHFAGVVAGLLPAHPYSTYAAVVLGCYAVASYAATHRGAVVGGAALGVAGLAVVALSLGDPTPPTDLPIVAFLAAGAWATGWAARSTTGRALRLWAGEVRAAAEHPVRVRAALEEERRRVALDLHDIVAHGVSLVGVLAGAAAAAAPRDAERARATLATAADAVAETRVELGRLTAVLRPGVEEAPPVSLDGIGELVERARRGGQDVELACPAAIPVPPGVWVSAYRIVQEALTNARKHAPGATASVRLGIDGGALVVEIENGAAPARAAGPGTRQGIAGMRERARLLDGELHAAPTGSGGFRVRARLPLPHIDPHAPATPGGAAPAPFGR